jgi:hypothetical protein
MAVNVARSGLGRRAWTQEAHGAPGRAKGPGCSRAPPSAGRSMHERERRSLFAGEEDPARPRATAPTGFGYRALLGGTDARGRVPEHLARGFGRRVSATCPGREFDGDARYAARARGAFAARRVVLAHPVRHQRRDAFPGAAEKNDRVELRCRGVRRIEREADRLALTPAPRAAACAAPRRAPGRTPLACSGRGGSAWRWPGSRR